MKLLTKEIRNSIPKVGETDGDLDAKVAVKFFTPWTNWTWYAFEGNPVLDDDGNEVDFEFFGLVDGFEKELGYFVLSELESVNGPWGLKIERDMHYTGPSKRDLFASLGLTHLIPADVAPEDKSEDGHGFNTPRGDWPDRPTPEPYIPPQPEPDYADAYIPEGPDDDPGMVICTDCGERKRHYDDNMCEACWTRKAMDQMTLGPGSKG